MIITPPPPLQPFVSLMWATEPRLPNACEPRCEHLLPTGQMHIVFRLSPTPLRIFSCANDVHGQDLGQALLGGARKAFYVRELAAPGMSVGAQLRPGCAEWLFGVSAAELAHRHSDLEDLWGPVAVDTLQRLQQAKAAHERLRIFCQVLHSRLPRLRGMHPAVAQALTQVRAGYNVADIVKASGYSHRHFNALFLRAVGLTPKALARIQRFQSTLGLLQRGVNHVHIAHLAGYSDQAHFNRDFLHFSGVTPGQYQQLAPDSDNHLPVSPQNQHQTGTKASL